MTRWGLLLLGSYVGLGLSSLSTRRAAQAGVALTAAVLLIVFFKIATS